MGAASGVANNTRGAGASRPPPCVVNVVACVMRFNEEDAVHQVDEVDEVHQVHQVDPTHQIDDGGWPLPTEADRRAGLAQALAN